MPDQVRHDRENFPLSSLLHPLLNGIAGNFEKDDRGESILETLIKIENLLIENGLLESDYIFYVAQKKLSTDD